MSFPESFLADAQPISLGRRALQTPLDQVDPTVCPVLCRARDWRSFREAAAMFWRVPGYSQPSPLEAILDMDNFTLEEVLDEADLVQECKSLNGPPCKFPKGALHAASSPQLSS